ncbi:general secretion pathway protein GspB [Rheinheimera sp. 1928-s]|uniref:general secretion pathway protein GspB n=1 Tax=Rheinheimera sp. 1928-s TaxID=3033803 RepID=UPI00261E37D4|nr:general secretion pathway protein GspB [Rheinheimera sp. 1928-s]MDF3124720.1 general secretion pathway protein GspB [Rheinheimera sp. 1928-s]
MSLLMDALKQQQQVPMAAEQTASGHGWRIVALILLVVLGLVLGFFVGQYQFNKKEPAAVAEAVAAPVVQAAPVIANAADIAMELQLAADLLKPAEPVQLEEVPEDDRQLVVSAKRGEKVLGRSIGDERDDDFVDFEQMQEADLQDDLTPVDELLPAAELEQSDVSAELRGKFESALAAADGSQLRQQQINYHDAPAMDINQLDDLLQRQLPSLRFEAHVYATDAKQRWIKVNGKDLQQGQWVTADIQVKEILPQYVVLQFNQTQFSVEALADWSYQRR